MIKDNKDLEITYHEKNYLGDHLMESGFKELMTVSIE